MLIIGHLFQFPPGNYEAVETTHCSCREKLRIFQPPKTSDILKHPQHTVWPLTQGSSKATAIDCSFLVWFCAREMGKFTHQREREKLQKRERERECAIKWEKISLFESKSLREEPVFEWVFEWHWSEFGCSAFVPLSEQDIFGTFLCRRSLLCIEFLPHCRLMVSMSRNEACCGSNPLPDFLLFCTPF